MFNGLLKLSDGVSWETIFWKAEVLSYKIFMLSKNNQPLQAAVSPRARKKTWIWELRG